MSDELNTLADRLEAAERCTTALFIEAGRQLFIDRQRNPLWSEYCSYAEDEAWLSAAEMLVPEGMLFAVGQNESDAIAALRRRNENESVGQVVTAATPALALCAAALRARSKTNG